MAISVSNGSANPLTIWIEPWCDELSLPPRSTARFESSDKATDDVKAVEIEAVEGRLVVWPFIPGTITVSIDGALQRTDCYTIPIQPEMLELPVKSFIELAFANTPQARPTGAIPAADDPETGRLRSIIALIPRIVQRKR